MSSRAATLAVSFGMGVLWVALLSLAIPGDTTAAAFLLDRNTEWSVYPFTVQNLMWVVFFVTAGEIAARHLAGMKENEQLGHKLLPEDDRTVLRKKDLGPVYRRVSQSSGHEYWLQRLLTSAILQFQSSGSIAQVNAIFNSSMELFQHESELRYNLLRYLVWLIPTLGFVGTVLGIALALQSAGGAFAGVTENTNMAELGPEMMQSLTGQLGVAFYTTLLALLQSAVLMFAMHLVQEREERALNQVGQYCLKNLLNRLYEQPGR